MTQTFFAFTDWQLYFYFIYFCLALFFTIFIPGFLILNLKKNKLDFTQQLLLSPVIGLVVFTLLSYLFSILNAFPLMYLYIVISFIWFIRKNSWQRLFKIKKKFRLSKLAIFLITFGSILQISAVFASGLRYENGLRFYWINGADGIFNLSLIQSLSESLPAFQPGAWPLKVSNYHFLSNLFFAKFCQIWQIPFSHALFQYLPLLVAPLMGLTVASLIDNWTKNKKAVNWALFFLYFSADVSWIFCLLINHSLNWQVSSIDNGMIQFLNMPQTFAKQISLTALILFDHWRKEKNNYLGFLAVFLFSSLVGFKVYFGIFFALAYTIFVTYRLIKEKSIRKNILEISFLLGFALVSGLIFFANNKDTGGLFWAPFDWAKLYLSQISWREWSLRMQVYEAAQNQKAILTYNFIALLIFIFSLFSTRLIGLLSILPKKQKLIGKDNFYLLFPATTIIIFLGLNTLQVSGGHNVFNFFIVALNVLTLCTAVVLGASKKRNLVLSILIVLLTLPRIIFNEYRQFADYYLGFNYILIDNNQLEAYDFIKNNYQDKLIQGHPQNYLVKETPHLHFFTEQKSYFDGALILHSHNQKVENRELILKNIFSHRRLIAAKSLLESEVDLIMLSKKYNERLSIFNPIYNPKTRLTTEDCFSQLDFLSYENQEIELYEIDRQSLENCLIKEKSKISFN
jgi:hypothetical protein